MERRKIFSFSGILIAAALFVLVNLVASATLKNVRLDLTEGNLHTLSEGTVNILNNLDETISLKLFWSQKLARDLPSLDLFARRVRELLAEYQSKSGGKLVLSVIDPEPFSEEEDEAVSLGLQGVPIQGGSATLYFGLSGEDVNGRVTVMPFVQPDREAFLEYDISQMIYTLSHPDKVIVGLLSALPITGGPSPANPFQMMPPWMISDQLHKQFDLQVLSDGEAIPDDIDVLMMVHPHDLSDKALYAADQFVLNGGPALVFADPVSEFTSRLNPDSGIGEETTADSLLAAWGVNMEPGKVVGDLELSRKVTFRGRLGLQTANYLPWISIRDDLINREEMVTAQLTQLNLASAGSLLQTRDARTEFVPLLSSTGRSMLIQADKVALMPDPARIMSEFVASGVVFTLGARVSGPTSTAFPDGPPPSSEESDDEKTGDVRPDHIADSIDDINVIVIADTDLLQDGFWVEVQDFFGQRIAIPLSDNADLLVNALDQLGGSPDLIGLRGRASTFRPFTLLDRVASEAELRYRSKEQELQTRLNETEGRLSELQALRSDPDSPELTAEQESELESFLEEKVKIRKELREVQYELRRDIERLEGWIKFINIGLVPLLAGAVVVGTWLIRRRKDRRAVSRS